MAGLLPRRYPEYSRCSDVAAHFAGLSARFGAPPLPGGTRSLALIFSLLFMWSVFAPAIAQTVVFSDDFDATPTTCDTLAPNWTTTDANLSGIGTFTSNSNACSLFTRGAAVALTSSTVDLSSATGADLTAWVRKGSDAFSEDPDNSGESLTIEFFDSTGIWLTLQSFDAGALAPGAITNVNISLPANALHANFQLRISQQGGSGGPPANGGLGWDFWHVDDVVVTETNTPPPPPDLTANSCDDFEGGALNNWAVTNAVRIGINNDTANSPTNSMFIRHGAATATSVPIDARGLATFSIWIRRGSDTFSENPEAGEDLTLEYFNSSNAWTTLETFTGGGTQGQIFTRVYTAAADFRHANFRVRLSLATGSGSDFDYWHIDDVCFVSGAPNISVNKTVSIESDPIGTPTNPFAIPGSIVRYAIAITNTGVGVVDANTIQLSDLIDPNIEMFVGDLNGSGSPIIFTDGVGADASGVSLPFVSLGDSGDGVTFLNSSNVAFTPTQPFDENVATLELNFSGSMNGTGAGGTPNFTIEFEARVK